jgi:photosystem II stability/assembly factor-like uncharacterized protein
MRRLSRRVLAPAALAGVGLAVCGLAVAACATTAPTKALVLPVTSVSATARSALASTAAKPAAVTALPDSSSVTGPTYADLAFPSAADGWLIGQPAAGPGAASTSTVIWHTSTAGARWQVQWRGTGDPLSLTATDSAHAWALIGCLGTRCMPKLLVTADGGQRWTTLTRLPYPVRQVQFVSARVGLATSDGCLTVPSLTRCPGKVLISYDGGATWQPLLSGAGPVFATAAVSSTGAIQLWAAQAVLTAGDGAGPQVPAIKISTSVSGGRSWLQLGQLSLARQLATPNVQVKLAATSAGLSLASVFDEQTCAMHGCGTTDLLQSSNGGRTWSQAALTDPDTDAGCGYTQVLSSVAPDGAEWAATGSPAATCSPPFGLLFRRGSSGWQLLPPWQLTGASSLDAVSTNIAYAIAAGATITRTEDGGRTWTQLLPAPSPTGQIDALSATTALGAQDAVNAGAILRSSDGGRSWQQIADLPGAITQLDFPAQGDGIAVTYKPGTSGSGQSELWRSTDGGQSWTPAGRLPGDAGIGNTGSYGPWLSADGHGVLLTAGQMTPWQLGSGGGAPAQLWTTSDWGAHWTKGSLLSSYADGALTITSASFTTAGTGPGWLVSQSQILTATGRTLTPVTNSPQVSDAQLLRPGAGIAWGISGGQNGKTYFLSIYRTTDNGIAWQHSQTTITLPPQNQQILISFTDLDHGWLVIGGSTWLTANGGRTWTHS